MAMQQPKLGNTDNTHLGPVKSLPAQARLPLSVLDGSGKIYAPFRTLAGNSSTDSRLTATVIEKLR